MIKYAVKYLKNTIIPLSNVPEDLEIENQGCFKQCRACQGNDGTLGGQAVSLEPYSRSIGGKGAVSRRQKRSASDPRQCVSDDQQLLRQFRAVAKHAVLPYVYGFSHHSAASPQRDGGGRFVEG